MRGSGIAGYDSDNDDAVDDVDIGQYIDVQDALAVLVDRNVQTRAPEAVEDVIWKRISGYDVLNSI